MKLARLFPNGLPDPDVQPVSREQLRSPKQGELFPAPTPTEAELVDARLKAAMVERLEREASRPKRDESGRSRRKREVRARTISVKRMTKRELELGRMLYPEVEDVVRPVTREDCAQGERPCPFVSCKHHLYLDVSARTGAIKLNFPDLEVWEMTETCALDVADRGGTTLEDVGAIMNLTRERIRQVEVKGLARMKAADGAGDVLREYAGEGAVGKRRLPVLQADDDEDDSQRDEQPDDDAAFDAEEFASVALDSD